MLCTCSDAEDKKQDRQNRFWGAVFISAFLWPVWWPAARRQWRFERDLQSGRRPQWLARDEGEHPDVECTLADGTEFFASPVEGSSRPTLIQAGCEGVLPERVEYRIRKLAPDADQPSEWKPLRLKRAAPDPEDEDQEEEWSYEASLNLSRGKYRADLRVRPKGKESEECGSITLIVADPEDFDL